MDKEAKEYLTCERFAVVGASRRHDKYGYKVMRNLIERGKTVIPVNPGASDIDGITCYASIKDIPSPPDAVHIITSPEVTERVAKECVELGVKYVWMQPGASSDSAVKYLQANGVSVLWDRCILML
ncbi:MAG: CoA-binding protein [Spirochaetes bacterium]|nr:CoA-binding protein [Spirochaetota bacterium]